MSVASRITSMTEHIQNAYDSIERFGVDTESIDKNLVNLSNTITNEIYDKLPKVSGNGSNFTLENAQKGKLDLFEMEGNTEQDSYSGINLLDTNDINYQEEARSFISNKIGEIIINGTTTNKNVWLKQGLNKPLNGTYTLIFKKISGEMQTTNTRIRYTIGNPSNEGAASIPGRLISDVFDKNSEIITTRATINDTLDSLSMYINAGATFIDYKVAIYLVEGTYTSENIPNYEPYVGGSQSPSPDFPQPIEVVENKQNINVSGKNLLPYPYPENIKTMNGVTFTVQNDGSVLVNGTATAQANIKLFGLQYQDTQKEFPAKYLYGGTNSVRLRALNNTNESYVVLATDAGNGAEIDMSTHNKGYIELTVPNGTTVNNVLIKPMMLNSLDDTTYEPYQSKDYEIDLHGKNLCSSVELQSYANIRFYIDKKIEKTITISFTTNESLNNNSLYLEAGGSQGLATTISASANTKATATFTLTDAQYNAIQNASTPYFLLFKSGANFTIPTDAQIENDSTATEYEEFYDYKLCKIGDYKDVIFKNNQLSEYYDSTLDEDSWYIKKEIGKVDLSTFTWNQAGHNVTDYKRYYTNTIPNIKYVSSNTQIGNGIAEKYIIAKGQGISSVTNVIAIDVSIVSVTDKNTPSGLFYYELATPTYETITNSTLINQLEAIETENGTNIFEVSNDNDVLPSLNVKRLKELEKLS